MLLVVLVVAVMPVDAADLLALTVVDAPDRFVVVFADVLVAVQSNLAVIFELQSGVEPVELVDQTVVWLNC